MIIGDRYIIVDITSVTSGWSLLANGGIIAEEIENIYFVLWISSVVGRAKGCIPNRGDNLVASLDIQWMTKVKALIKVISKIRKRKENTKT